MYEIAKFYVADVFCELIAQHTLPVSLLFLKLGCIQNVRCV